MRSWIIFLLGALVAGGTAYILSQYKQQELNQKISALEKELAEARPYVIAGKAMDRHVARARILDQAEEAIKKVGMNDE